MMLLEGDLASALGRFRGAPGCIKTNVGYYRSVGLNHRSAQLASDKRLHTWSHILAGKQGSPDVKALTDVICA